MILKQISVFIENTEGKMLTVTKVLKDNGINIRTLSLADTSEYGMLRLIVSDPEEAKRVIREAGFPVSITEVLAIRARDEVGYLHDLIEALSSAMTSIEYMYTLPTDSEPLIILKVADPGKVEKVLEEKNF